MHIPLLFGGAGALLHFLFFLFIGKPFPSLWTALVLPAFLSAGVLYVAIRNTRKFNNGHLAFREGFFMGMNVSTVMGIGLGAFLWFYFAEIAPDEAWWMVKDGGISREEFLKNANQMILGWAFRAFLFTFLAALPFSGLFGWILRTTRKPA